MMRIPDARSRFLNALQFKADPFLTPVAEQELLRLKSLFFNFFVPIPSSHGLLSPQLLLQRQEHDFIFGAPGSGKTTLRLALEAETRSVITPVVTASYLFGEQSYRLRAEEHLLSLGQTLAVDLVVHLLERFDPLDIPSKEQVQALSKLVNIGGTKLKRTLCTIRDEIGAQNMDPHWGIAHFWETLGKMPVRYVEGSQALANLISTVLEDVGVSSHFSDTGIELETIFEVARLWGISRIFLLVDAIDTVNLPAETLLNSIKSFLELLSALRKYPLTAKFFLPSELLEGIREHSARLHFNVNFIIIEWNEQWQNELIRQRLRAVTGGPHYSSLDQLAEPGLDLSAKLIAASRGSPRRLLQIINRLLAICAERERDTIAITRNHWQQLESELEPREDVTFWRFSGLREACMNRFIERPLVMERIKEWIFNSGNQKSVLSLVGPPGSGKTTLLSMLVENHLQGVKVLSLPLPSEFFQDGCISEEQARRLLERVLNITPDPHATPTAILQNWVRKYCEEHPLPIPLFLADGYDEIPDSYAEEYSRKILEPIVSFACTRLIVARREDFPLRSLVLSLHQTRLHLNQFGDINADFARQQFEKLGGGSISSQDIQNWMAHFIEYRWENPLLNELLFLKASNGKLKAPEASTIREVINEAVARSGKFPALTETQFRYLCILAGLDEQWSGREAEQALRISNFYFNREITEIFQLGLIIEIENSIKHMLASGFRGLLREFNRL